MKSFDGISIFTDLDGTLLNSQKILSARNASAMFNFTKNGGKISLATGRDISGIEPCVDLTYSNLPLITLNGCEVIDIKTKKSIVSTVLDESAIETVNDVMSNFPSTGLIIVSFNMLHICKTNKLIDESEYLRVCIKQHVNIDVVPKPWTKVIFVDEPELVSELEKYVSNIDKFHFTQSDVNFIEMFNLSSNKGIALKKVCELENLDLGKTIAIGDNNNDIEMIKFAKVGICVKNASQRLKDVADIVLDITSDEHVLEKVTFMLEKGEISF